MTRTLFNVTSVDECRRLIAAGVEVNAKNKHGTTPLIYASYSEQSEIVKLLIEAGADVNAKDNTGNSALTYAYYNFEIAKVLVEAGADVNIENEEGPILIQLIMDNELDIVKLLVQAGADVNAEDEYNTSPLNYACHCEMIEFLQRATKVYGTVLVTVPDDYACAICQCHDDPKSKVLQLSHCVHQFHELCITTWATRSPTCPMCRTDL